MPPPLPAGAGGRVHEAVTALERYSGAASSAATTPVGSPRVAGAAHQHGCGARLCHKERCRLEEELCDARGRVELLQQQLASAEVGKAEIQRSVAEYGEKVKEKKAELRADIAQLHDQLAAARRETDAWKARYAQMAENAVAAKALQRENMRLEAELEEARRTTTCPSSSTSANRSASPTSPLLHHCRACGAHSSAGADWLAKPAGFVSPAPAADAATQTSAVDAGDAVATTMRPPRPRPVGGAGADAPTPSARADALEQYYLQACLATPRAVEVESEGESEEASEGSCGASERSGSGSSSIDDSTEGRGEGNANDPLMSPDGRGGGVFGSDGTGSHDSKEPPMTCVQDDSEHAHTTAAAATPPALHCVNDGFATLLFAVGSVRASTVLRVKDSDVLRTLAARAAASLKVKFGVDVDLSRFCFKVGAHELQHAPPLSHPEYATLADVPPFTPSEKPRSVREFLCTSTRELRDYQFFYDWIAAQPTAVFHVCLTLAEVPAAAVAVPARPRGATVASFAGKPCLSATPAGIPLRQRSESFGPARMSVSYSGPGRFVSPGASGRVPRHTTPSRRGDTATGATRRRPTPDGRRATPDRRWVTPDRRV